MSREKLGDCNLIDHTIIGMSDVSRYNTRSRIKNESIAEHSFYVAYNVMVICKELGLSEEIRGQALTYAIVHDIPEIGTGDIPFDTKSNSPVIAEELEKLELEYLSREFSDMAETYEDYLKSAIAHSVVSLADMISVIQYTSQEERLGNTTLTTIKSEAVDIALERLATLRLYID